MDSILLPIFYFMNEFPVHASFQLKTPELPKVPPSPYEDEQVRLAPVEAIAVGGNGIVWRGTFAEKNQEGVLGSEEEVALKRIPYSSPDELVRILQEVASQRRIANYDRTGSMVQPIHAVDDDKAKCVIIAMPLLGANLAEHLKTRRLTLDQTLRYLDQAAQAIQSLHTADIIHGDIKPANFLLTRDSTDKVVLADFGTVRQREGTAQQWTRAHTTGMFITPHFAAPEQYDYRTDKASDQYQLAVMAYSLFSGVLPFKGTYAELQDQHRYATPPAFAELTGKQYTQAYLAAEKCILKALSKQPQDRYESVAAFVTALHEATGLYGQWTSSLPVAYLGTLAAEHIVHGISALGQDRDILAATKHFTAAADTDPGSVTAHHLKSLGFAALNLPGAAEERDLTRSLQARNFDEFVIQGHAAFEVGAYQEARTYFEAALEGQCSNPAEVRASLKRIHEIQEPSFGQVVLGALRRLVKGKRSKSALHME